MARFKVIQCPLCNGKIEIDLNTGQVYRHFDKKTAEEAVDAFDKVVGKVAAKQNSAVDLFDQATEKEKNKDLDSLFDEAARKAKKEIAEE